MKSIQYVLISTILLMQSIFSLEAQNTEGTDFWLTFGKNHIYSNNTLLRLQIRVVGGSNQTEGRIYFTHLETYIDFNINPYGTYTYNLYLAEREAVYNTVMGITDYSMHITTSKPVSVYAYNHYPDILDDVTNVLPVTALGTKYYHMSYTVNRISFITLLLDAYAVVAIKDNTQLYHNGELIETLNAGQVYYKTSDVDMTGSLITSNNPIAFFAAHQGNNIPPDTISCSNLFQQLPPVNTWDKKFFVPVSVMDKEIVRIVASENGTNITQTGGVIRPSIPGAIESLTNLQAGQFVELDISLSENGCYIEANNPVGVCSYFRGFWNISQFGTNPAQCWVPGLDQKISQSKIAPFIPYNTHYLSAFYALVVTPTSTKNSTTVSIGGAPPTALQGGNWYDNTIASMSFYSMPLTNITALYVFSNAGGFIIYGYAHGSLQPVSYYYLAGSAILRA
jgi:hypothetical protein